MLLSGSWLSISLVSVIRFGRDFNEKRIISEHRFITRFLMNFPEVLSSSIREPRSPGVLGYDFPGLVGSLSLEWELCLESGDVFLDLSGDLDHLVDELGFAMERR